MKYFICALNTFNLGIPADLTGRIINAERTQTDIFETEDDIAFVSIPALFRQKNSTLHGLVLKTGAVICKWPGSIILLTPRIEIDLEILDEEIRPLPDSFSGAFFFVKGAFFSAGQNMIMIIDPEKLLEKII